MGLSFTKLFSRLFAKKEARLLMVGLDAAGFIVETVEYNKICFTVWDISHQNNDELIDAKLLVFANKQDLPNAMTAAEITDKLGLHSLGQRCWHIHNTSAISREGLYEGLDWLSNNIADKGEHHELSLQEIEGRNCVLLLAQPLGIGLQMVSEV
ncbi:unnamed protein product [Ilex paraguariensis]|uniref:ADP-ribosylation factor 1 n=1 Tax=Ilex paraguariensis TaxID=185542 RepID=A0ABC8TY40_9AQUA